MGPGTPSKALITFSLVLPVVVAIRYAIHNLVKPGTVTSPDGTKLFQYTEYFEGIAAQHKPLDALGAINGFGSLDILRNAYKVCCEQLQQGNNDEIFLFGFSRGAFISRALASFLQYVGLIKLEHMHDDISFMQRFEELVTRYTKIKGSKPPTNPSKDFMYYCKKCPRVRLIGAFDSVKGKFFHHDTVVDFETNAPHIVDNVRHALALNEDRWAFKPDFWKSPTNLSSSYEQAWFLGHHHDIGGGSAQQGLALWPLQWILQSAIDYGLVLDGAVDLHRVLFSGAQKTIDTSHKIALRMNDMITHHRQNTPWALRLNPSASPLTPTARKFWKSITAPPLDPNCHKLKTFIHPSAYLIFDVSSSFRIQVQSWRSMGRFIAAREMTLKEAVPWWEQSAIQCTLEESTAVERVNILVYGGFEAGKTEMIKRVFGKVCSGCWGSTGWVPGHQARDHDIYASLLIPDNSHVRVYYSNWFGSMRALESFLNDFRGVRSRPHSSRLHAVWFFVDPNKNKLDRSDKEFLQMNFGHTVVHIIANQSQLNDDVKRELNIHSTSDCNNEQLVQQIENGHNPNNIATNTTDIRRFVPTRTQTETLERLSSETLATIESPEARLSLIKAQRVLTKPKIALAVEESIRAYTIWHSLKFGHQQIPFWRNKDRPRLTLTLMLMEPILQTFNARCPGDDKLIQSKIGGRWTGLDQYKPNLQNPGIPGRLILMCMIDTTIIMIRALSHQKVDGKTRLLTDPVRPLQATDIDAACKWYTSPYDNRQTAMHEKIKSLLSGSDWSPSDRSISNLQTKVIEAAQLEADYAAIDTMSILHLSSKKFHELFQ